MILGVRVVERHVDKERLHMHIENPLDLVHVEIRVDEYRTNKSLDHVGQALGRLFDRQPVVHGVRHSLLGSGELLFEITDRPLQLRLIVSEMGVQAKLDADHSQEMV